MSEAVPDLNKVVHERVRLAILAALAGSGPHTFVELKEVTCATDGNLSAHLTTLEKHGYVKIGKSFKGKRPRTTVDVTAAGRRALAAHVSALERILKPGETR